MICFCLEMMCFCSTDKCKHVHRQTRVLHTHKIDFVSLTVCYVHPSRHFSFLSGLCCFRAALKHYSLSGYVPDKIRDELPSISVCQTVSVFASSRQKAFSSGGAFPCTFTVFYLPQVGRARIPDNAHIALVARFRLPDNVYFVCARVSFLSAGRFRIMYFETDSVSGYLCSR